MAHTADHWPAHPLVTPPEFWSQDLRYPDYGEALTLAANPQLRLSTIRKTLVRRQQAAVVCKALNVGEDGSLSDLQERVAEHPVVAFLLLATRFARGKRRAAIADVVEAMLTEDARRDCCYLTDDGALGEPDPIAAVIRLYQADPGHLKLVRALDLWHRSATSCFVLDGALGVLPRQGFDGFVLTDPAFQVALDAANVTFEGLFPRGNGQWLLFVSRKLRRTHILVGPDVVHGSSEELVVLEVLEGGRAVRVASKSRPAPVAIADAIASKYFGGERRYKQDRERSPDAAVRSMLAHALDPDDADLELVHLAVRQAPFLAGEPGLSVYATHGQRIEQAVGQLEERLGAVTDPDRLRRFTVRFDGQVVPLYLERDQDGLVVQIADGRVGRATVEALQGYCAETFGVFVRSAYARKRT
jgi:hypothetical protein